MLKKRNLLFLILILVLQSCGSWKNKGIYTNSEEDIRECVQYFQAKMFSNKLYEYYMDLPFGKNLPFVTKLPSDRDCLLP